MKGTCLLVLLGGLVVTSAARGAGFAHTANANVLAPDQALAEAVLAKAEEYRRQIALEWLGEELPPGAGPVAIHVRLSDVEDTGLTLPIDSPRRKFHRIWLITTRERALGSTLHHEMVHAVLATRFAGRLPIWSEEGIAGTKDDPDRITLRRDLLDQYSRTAAWPPLKTLLEARRISVTDEEAYSVAASLMEFLLSRGDKPTFLRFAVAGQEEGWDRAVGQYYGFRSVDDLQAAWQHWVTHRRQPRSVASR